MTKVIVSSNDPIVYIVYDKDESDITFGEDYIQEYGTEIPDELINDYKKAYMAFWNIQDKIRLCLVNK